MPLMSVNEQQGKILEALVLGPLVLDFLGCLGIHSFPFVLEDLLFQQHLFHLLDQVILLTLAYQVCLCHLANQEFH